MWRIRGRSLCAITVSSDFGTGIVIDGLVYRGAGSGAGDGGRVRSRGDNDMVCQCGAHGSLPPDASRRALVVDREYSAAAVDTALSR
ncbi:ROK family protein [Microbacterium sp. Root180]|uniref:ROK family protein n=1 Tax=Microbacterium sp. Root180 TaxID=1736483 RepID=UPI0006F9DE9F|nr:hypothetical protein ASD93_00115 [Microbacterium sp. Root180]